MAMEFEFKENVQVVNPARPEWGIGKILSVEPGPGGRGSRVRVNFAGAGVKTMMIPPGQLVPPEAKTPATPDKPLEDQLRAVPEVVRDRRASLETRIIELAKLFQFGDDPRGIFDWAVYQLGRSDPLNDFTADELKAYYEDFKRMRDKIVKDLYRETCRTGGEKSFKSFLDEKVPKSLREKMTAVLS